MTAGNPEDQPRPTVPDCSEVMGYVQNGSAGCQTACMANIARYFNHENITPTDVDVELGRDPDSDITVLTQDLWLLKRGLKLTLLTGNDPVRFADYINGTIDFETLLRNQAAYKFGDSIELARKAYDIPEYHAYVNLQKTEHQKNAPIIEEYRQCGQLFEVRTEPCYQDIVDATSAGSMVLAHTRTSSNVYHQTLFFADEVVDGEFRCLPRCPVDGVSGINFYYPHTRPDYEMIYSADEMFFDIDYRSLIVVSRHNPIESEN